MLRFSFNHQNGKMHKNSGVLCRADAQNAQKKGPPEGRAAKAGVVGIKI